MTRDQRFGIFLMVLSAVITIGAFWLVWVAVSMAVTP